jgi:SAM-dependent methyltransferase
MKPHDRALHWDHIFASRDETAVSWYESSPDLALGLITRFDLERDAPIVDVGTGLSRVPDRLLALGFRDLTVLDVSAEAIARGERRRREAGLAPASGINSVVGDVTTWRPQRRFRLWHDRVVLHFLTDEADRAAYRQVLDAAVVPGGHALIATFAPAGPERCSGLPVRRYGPTELEAFAAPTFALVDSIRFDHPTPGGAVQRCHLGHLRRRA